MWQLGHDLRFGWHGYLWYNKVSVDVKINYVREAILKTWSKSRLCPKIPLWISAQKAFYRPEIISKHKWYYVVIQCAIFFHGDYKMIFLCTIIRKV